MTKFRHLYFFKNSKKKSVHFENKKKFILELS